MESDRLIVCNQHKTAIPFYRCVAWMLRAPEMYSIVSVQILCAHSLSYSP
jgi:hypothetical protein